MAADRARIDIAVCTRDRLHRLRTLLPALVTIAHRRPGTRVLVVDNGSCDGTGAWLADQAAREPLLVALAEDRPGLYHARTCAIAASPAEILLFLDDDVGVAPGLLDGIDDLFADPAIGVVGGSVEATSLAGLPPWFPRRFLSALPVIPLSAAIEDCLYPRYPIGACLAVRRHPSLSLYLAPERSRAALGHGAEGPAGQAAVGGEDTDLCEIYARAGLRVVRSARLRVTHPLHPERLTPAWLMEQQAREGRLRVRLARLRGKRALCRETAAILLTLPALVALRPLAALLPAARGVTLRARLAKSLGAWAEMVGGPRHLVLPYPARR
ncbi:glycosyltransferase [Roseomonas stagni]|uniref:Glycosyltransferase n=1 Tax=Falsiroseomonas algicola TaxID=2716930 RepID=A0A6M1LVK0_9PROT|nr:glycosyltransferase [Falsiroseomonas algicola]NGM24207.1 glycosyltransferase [Falsiroseomonas algicola]